MEDGGLIVYDYGYVYESGGGGISARQDVGPYQAGSS